MLDSDSQFLQNCKNYGIFLERSDDVLLTEKMCFVVNFYPIKMAITRSDPGSGSATMRCIAPYLGGKRMPQCQTGRHLVHDPPAHNKIYHSHVT